MDYCVDNRELTKENLRETCIRGFVNLGWKVRENQTIQLNDRLIKPDIVLYDNRKQLGFVEILTPINQKDIKKMKEIIKTILGKLKPKIFILTNGMEYDIFFDGNFAGTQSVPPSLQTIRSMRTVSK